jgi:hypothetical protein
MAQMRFIILFASSFCGFLYSSPPWSADLTMPPENADWVYKSVNRTGKALYTLADLGTQTIAL